MERKRVLRQYFFSLTVILCMMAFLTGIITVSERTRYNMELTSYEEVKFTQKADGIEIAFGENKLFLKREDIENMGKSAFFSLLGDVFTDAGEFFAKNVN